jgi:hypothetical protein
LKIAFDLLALIARACEEHGIPYAVGGSVAAMMYGELRLTTDIDVVVHLRPGDVPRLLAHFPHPRYYRDEHAALEAIRTGGQFNIIDNETGLKADIFIADDEISRRQVDNARRMETAFGGVAMVSPPEELILMKLKYYSFAWTEKHLRDISGMLDSPLHDIDEARIQSLAEQHGLAHVWQAVQSRRARG